MDGPPIALTPEAENELRAFLTGHKLLREYEGREFRRDPLEDLTGYFWHELHEPFHRAVAGAVTWPVLHGQAAPSVPAPVPVEVVKFWEREELREPSTLALDRYPLPEWEAQRILQQLSEADRETFGTFRDYARCVTHARRPEARAKVLEAIDREVSYLTGLRRQLSQAP